MHPLLVQAMDLGVRQKIHVWDWRSTSWEERTQFQLLPTSTDRLILLKRCSARYCLGFATYIALAEQGLPLPPADAARAIALEGGLVTA